MSLSYVQTCLVSHLGLLNNVPNKRPLGEDCTADFSSLASASAFTLSLLAFAGTAVNQTWTPAYPAERLREK